MPTPIDIQDFFRNYSDQSVIYRYLDRLAERTALLEQQSNKSEMAQLRAENKLLRSQLAQGSPMSLEQLVAFLPVIYRNFWNSVSPGDLALLAGSLNISRIPSPCPEPAEEVISMMKQRLMAMPPHERNRIIEYCRQLPFKLNMRPEMKYFFK